MQRRRNADVIVETLDLEGKRVIDVGCGDGNLTRLMARNGAHVLGVECSPRQLATAWKADKVSDERIVEGVGQALPAEDGSADMVVFFNSLHHIPAEHMAQALAEAHRVLVPGGMVYVSEPVAEGKFFETCRPVDDETQVRAQALACLRQADGFQMKDEILYLHTVTLKTYEAFRDRIVSANHEREERFAVLDEQMRALYAANGRPNGEGAMEFDQPMRVNLLVKL
ncbi:MAG: class I SAM-dependent methyltransferase [Magnetospirillum gryphiswaldense]|nr:class I SAM-dependent methyltransferase [Magnetospirillum gryphiswaldense]